MIRQHWPALIYPARVPYSNLALQGYSWAHPGSGIFARAFPGFDGRCPSLDSSPLSLRATSKIFSSKFGAREVCIAPQSMTMQVQSVACREIYEENGQNVLISLVFRIFET